MSERAILAGRRESEGGMRERWDDASESPMRVESQTRRLADGNARA